MDLPGRPPVPRDREVRRRKTLDVTEGADVAGDGIGDRPRTREQGRHESARRTQPHRLVESAMALSSIIETRGDPGVDHPARHRRLRMCPSEIGDHRSEHPPGLVGTTADKRPDRTRDGDLGNLAEHPLADGGQLRDALGQS